ncbi:MAG: insulinase family protein [Kofleriaceae bacterium]
MRSVAAVAFSFLVACGGSKPTPTPTPTPDPDRVAAGGASTGTTPAGWAIETPMLVPTPLANDPAKVTVHRLSNGMTVYISPDAEEPSIVAHVAVRAGSRHDPATSTGLAHYLEHMVFKGTTKLGTLDYAKEKPHLDRIATLYDDLRKPGADTAKIFKEIDSETQKSAAFEIPNELEALYARIGVTGLNAFTADDQTVYVSTIPKNRLAQWARVEAARYDDAVFRLFWPELEAVYEEKNRALDNPGRRVNEALMVALFPKHGYGYSSGIGEIEHLKKPAYGDMVTFFNRYYTPGNMAILLSGDVDASVIPLLEKEFGNFKRKPGAAVEPGEITPLKGRTELKVPVPSNEGVVLAWHLVSAKHADRYPLEVMDALLYDGQGGILQRDLLLTQKVANAGSSPTFQREAGYFELRADVLAGQSQADAEKLLLALVAKLQAGNFTDADLATAILTQDIRHQRQLESNGGRLSIMEDAFVNGEDWRDAIASIDRMRKVTKADVIRVAKQYLTANFIAVHKVKGVVTSAKIDKPGITAVKVDSTRQSAFVTQVLELPITPIEPVAIKEGQDYERGKLATGDLIVVKNRRNSLFTASHTYEYGRADDRLACLALEVLKVSGAGKRSAEQVSRELHELGLVITTTCAKNGSSITLSGVDKNLDAGMTLLRDWLADPAFDEATLKARVAASLTERANTMASPQAIVQASAAFARYGNDSELLVVATNKQLEAATPAQLKKLINRFLTMKHRTQYFGPRATADAGKAIQLGDGRLATKAPRGNRLRKPNTTVLVDQETAQTHVWLIWPRANASDADRAAGSVFAEYTRPLLYQEVREARGLAYTVFGGFDPGARKVDDAAAMAYVATQSDKTHDAIDAVLETMMRPIDPNRFAIAQETLGQSYRVDRIPPRAIANVVYTWDDQGKKTDPRAARYERASKIDKAALEAWTKTALAQQTIVSITGNRTKLDDAKLKKLPPVTTIETAKLFGF